jgi:hypothetical protein
MVYFLDGKQEGPYSPQELKIHARVTPDTFVRKKGWKEWIRIRHVPELKEVFEDEPKPKPLFDDNKKALFSDLLQDNAALTLTQQDPFHPYIWLLILISLLTYLIYLLYG